MNRFLYICLISCLGVLAFLTLSSCRGKAATKTIEVIEKAASKSGKAVKKVGKYGDDVYRAVDEYNFSSSSSITSTLKALTYQCASCAIHGQFNFVDEYGNYAYICTCPDCNGTGGIAKYEVRV